MSAEARRTGDDDDDDDDSTSTHIYNHLSNSEGEIDFLENKSFDSISSISTQPNVYKGRWDGFLGFRNHKMSGMWSPFNDVNNKKWSF